EEPDVPGVARYGLTRLPEDLGAVPAAALDHVAPDRDVGDRRACARVDHDAVRVVSPSGGADPHEVVDVRALDRDERRVLDRDPLALPVADLGVPDDDVARVDL